MEKIICFIRHGQTDINKSLLIQGQQNHQLNEFGRNQARKLGQYLRDYDIHWDVIYTSPLDRAYETAKIIAEKIQYTRGIVKNSAFIERNFGEAEGTPVCNETFYNLEHNLINGAETESQLKFRVMNELMRIIENTNDKKFLIVTHSHTIKAVLTLLDRNRKFSDLINNCSLNYLSYNGDELKIKDTNITVS